MPKKSIAGTAIGALANEETPSPKGCCAKKGAKPKCTVRNESLGEEEGEGEDPGRVTVSIRSFRNRLLDTDNLIGGVKYFVDGLRHAGLIHDDREEDIILQVSQRKVPHRSEEKTEITITYPWQ